MKNRGVIGITICSFKKILYVAVLCLASSVSIQAQNSHDLELRSNVKGAGVAQTRQQEEEGQPVIVPQNKSQAGAGNEVTAGPKTVKVDKLKVTTENEVVGGIEAKEGSMVSVGDVVLKNINAKSVKIDTKSKISRKIDVSNGDKFELGTVKLENYQGESLIISSDNTLTGNVKTKQGGTVSVGNTNVGDVAKQAEYMKNRGSLVDTARPDGLIPIQNNAANGSEEGNTSSDLDNLKTMEKDLLYAYMCECSYGSDRCLPEYRKALEESRWRVFSTDSELGLSVEYGLFKNEDTGKIVVAFRGTETTSSEKFGEDMAYNGGSAFISQINPMTYNKQHDYKESVVLFAESLTQLFGSDNIIFTGHSKGGGEALWASKKTNSEAVVFSPRSEAWTGDIYNSGQVRGYYVEGEALSYGRFWEYNKKILSDAPESSRIAKHAMASVIKSMITQISILQGRGEG